MKATLKKATSYLLRKIQEYYFSIFPDEELMKHLEERPGELSIESINICNANCRFCAYQYQERRKQRMTDSIFQKAISDFVDMKGGILYWAVVVGDPLLDPECVERIRYVSSFPCIKKIETVTNCLNLHKVGAKELLTSGLHSITVSTAGFDAEMYKRIYRNGSFLQMKENLLDLLRTNHALGRPVKINVELRIDRSLEDVIRCSEFGEVMELADAVDANYYFDSWSGRIKPEDLTGRMKIRPKAFFPMKKRIPCAQLWVGMGVLADGTVTACSCRDLNGDSDLVLGDIGTSSLRDLYKSDHLRKLRRDWFSGDHLPNICTDCSAYLPYTYLMLRRVKGEHFTHESS